MQVLFESHPGPAIPESDPELREVLLDSLKTYEQEEAQRPAFGEQPHIHVPESSPHAGIFPVELIELIQTVTTQHDYRLGVS